MAQSRASARQPFSILGALGILSLVDSIKTIPGLIGQWVDAWSNVTRPIWGFLVGWTGWNPPNFVADYLTIGLIVSGAFVRMTVDIMSKESKRDGDWSFFVNVLFNPLWIFGFNILSFVKMIVFWPFTVLGVISNQYDDTASNLGRDSPDRRIFFELFFYAVVILAIAAASSVAS